MKKIILISLTLFIIILISSLLIIGTILKRTADQPSLTEGIDLPSSENIIGTIEGSLGYPSEYIPEMKICAENIKTKEEFCTYEMINDKTFTNEIGYQIETSAGTYNIYSQLIDEKQKDADDYKAYYSKFVTCGMSVECNSHKKIDVKVKAGETTSDVDPIDWYDN